GEDPDLPTAESLTQHPTKFGVGSAGPLGIAQAATVGGVRKHEAARRASGLQHVGLPLLWAEARRAQLREHELLNPQVLAHPGALGVAPRALDRRGTAIKSENGCSEFTAYRGLRSGAFPFPGFALEAGPLFKREGALEPGRALERDCGGFDRKSPRSAHRVDEGCRRIPPAEQNQCRREGFPQGGLGRLEAPAATVEELPRAIDRECPAVVLTAGEHRHRV